MMTFSERKGLVSVSKTLQVDSMSRELRNLLWNIVYVSVLGRGNDRAVMEFAVALQFHVIKGAIDNLSPYPAFRLQGIKEYFFKVPWNGVYDFLEFVLSDKTHENNVEELLNAVLEQENAGYRIIDGIVTDIISEHEVEALNQEVNNQEYPIVAIHLKRALELYSDKENPDYRNSIKESISAVEAMAKIVAGSATATLADALKQLEKYGKLHKALKDGFIKLYGYTSDAGGIRHALMDEASLTKAEARYFLLSCTSFINYLKSNL